MKTTPPSILEQLGLSAEQRPAALERRCDVALVAGAGSGKTRTVTARYLGLLEEGVAVRHIVAITFTRKAAREMRNRIRREIVAYLQRDDLDDETRLTWQGRYEELNGARISTIHSLCAEILRAHPAEARIDPFFETLTEGEQAQAVADIAHHALAWAVTQEDIVPLVQGLTPAVMNDILMDLLWKRLDVAQSLVLCPLDPWPAWTEIAIAWFHEKLTQPGAVAAWDYLTELESNGAIAAAEAAGDKLAGPLREALHLWREIQRALATDDWPTISRLLPLLRRSFPNYGSKANWPVPPPMATVKALRKWYDAEIASVLGKDRLSKVNTDLDRDMARYALPLRRLAEYALHEYAGYKSARNALDFDDLEDMALRLLADPAHTAALDYWRGQISALLVDEFQDTNARQRDLIALLSKLPGDSPVSRDHEACTVGKLFIVGDGKQSIYRFRGADVTVFRRERAAIRQRKGLLCELSTSYRAHASLVDGLNALMASVLSPQEDPQRLYVEPFTPLRPYRAAPAQGMREPHIECHLVSGSKGAGAMDAAAAALANRLVELVESHEITLRDDHRERLLQYSDIAILCRKSRSFAYYEDALDRAGIPYVTVAGGGFYDRPEIRDLLNLLGSIADVGDDLALAGALRSPAFAVSDVGLYALCTMQRQAKNPTLWEALQCLVSDQPVCDLISPDDLKRINRAYNTIQHLRARRGRVTIAALLKEALDMTHYRAILIRAGQARALRNIDKLLMDAHTSGLVSVGEFLEYVQAMRDTSAREGEARSLVEGAVQIMSVHAAKGLEFPIVAIGDISSAEVRGNKRPLVGASCGLLLPMQNEAGQLPLIYTLRSAKEQEQEEEESRRLFYVAATRAQEKLIINGCLKANKDGVLGSQDGWMAWLAGKNLLNLENETIPLETETESILWMRQVEGVSVACHIYPIEYTSGKRATSMACEKAEVAFAAPPLLAGIALTLTPTSSVMGTSHHTLHLRRMAQREKYPPHAVGQVIHDALAQWRFAGPDFDAWIKATAQSYGVVNPVALARLCERTQRLLQRLWRHPLRERIETAKRRFHEAPFEMWWDGQLQTGRLDILWLDQQDQWHIADFKTDYIPLDMPLAEFWNIRQDEYRQQVRRYARAATQWLGRQPITEIVLLDYHGQIHIELVE